MAVLFLFTDPATTEIDALSLPALFRSVLGGGGGGKPASAQGQGQATDQVPAACEQLRAAFEAALGS